MSTEQLRILNLILTLAPLLGGIILLWEGYKGLVTAKKGERAVPWLLFTLYIGLFLQSLRLVIYYGCLVLSLPEPPGLTLVGGLIARGITAGIVLMFLYLQRARNGKGN